MFRLGTTRAVTLTANKYSCTLPTTLIGTPVRQIPSDAASSAESKIAFRNHIRGTLRRAVDAQRVTLNHLVQVRILVRQLRLGPHSTGLLLYGTFPKPSWIPLDPRGIMIRTMFGFWMSVGTHRLF